MKPSMSGEDTIFVAGHRGLVGSGIVRRLHKAGCPHILTRTSSELDLRDQGAVRHFFAEQRPRRVVLAAARVGGIQANNTFPAEFLRDNLLIQTNVIDAAYATGTEKLLFLASSCCYPRLCPQPMKEGYLLSGPLEPTNEGYALAKVAGIKMCALYQRQYGFRAIAAMPTNVYGPGDNFHPAYSHVIPAMLRRFHEAKCAGTDMVSIWGTGNARREFLHVDDLADALVFLMENYEEEEHINVGFGTDVSIRELAELIARVVGYEGKICFDVTKPDGMPQKLLDVSRMAGLGWKPAIGLAEGLIATYAWFLEQKEILRVDAAATRT